MKKNHLKVVEGVAGIWHYHLSETGETYRPALCGDIKVMCTSLPVTSWGTRGHLCETYCRECEQKAFIMGQNVGTLKEHEKARVNPKPRGLGKP